MRSFHVLKPGVFTTVQDLGRRRVAVWGVPPGGAFDTEALASANRLVGNTEDAAGLEWTLRGPELVADEDLMVAVVGAEFGATLGGVPLVRGRASSWPSGEALRSGWSSRGARAWMAVAGGVDVPLVLGSRSTDSTSRFGGLAGRMLIAGDVVRIGAARQAAREEDVARMVDPSELPERGAVELSCLPGPQIELFTRDFLDALAEAVWRVRPDSDRTGVRFERISGEMPSGPREIEPEGTTLGAVQLASRDLAIALGVDRPVTGGYPKPVVIAASDLGKLARLEPGREVRLLRARSSP